MGVLVICLHLFLYPAKYWNCFLDEDLWGDYYLFTLTHNIYILLCIIYINMELHNYGSKVVHEQFLQ